MKDHSTEDRASRITEEYKVLHEVARLLHNGHGTQDMLQNVLKVITRFDDLRVEHKAGIFLADHEKQVLRLYSTIGRFTQEFLEGEKEIPFGDCLCGKVAFSGELLRSDSCFADTRHERSYQGMTPHGHYIVPLKSRNKLVGVMFLYTNTHPSWYRHSQEVLISIGGLIADAIERNRDEERLRESHEKLEMEILERRQAEEKLILYQDRLEELVESRTENLSQANQKLQEEIQERKNVEDKLMNIKQQLRDLNNRLQSIREEEKARISRQVHDELGQSLTALKMDVVHLERRIPEDQKALREKTVAMKQLIDSTVQCVQRISMELRPPILDAFGICEAIAWQTEEYHKRTGIEFDLNCMKNHIVLENDLATTLFRIFQETLTNIIRHAQASRVAISLNRVQDHLILEVKDDGRGIQKEQIENPKSLGILGIRERVRNLGGEFCIQNNAGKGTAVTVKLPHASDESI